MRIQMVTTMYNNLDYFPSSHFLRVDDSKFDINLLFVDCL